MQSFKAYIKLCCTVGRFVSMLASQRRLEALLASMPVNLCDVVRLSVVLLAQGWPTFVNQGATVTPLNFMEGHACCKPIL